MKRRWIENDWRKRFAIFPVFTRQAAIREMIWLEWYWRRDMGEYWGISFSDPAKRHPSAQTDP